MRVGTNVNVLLIFVVPRVFDRVDSKVVVETRGIQLNGKGD